ncbi:MAG: hypothetical protein ACTHXF_08955 [Brevibacterium yomogidense]
MPKTIPGVPDFITREQWLELMAAAGFEPKELVEMRIAPDGVHALVIAKGENGDPVVDHQNGTYYKHRVFIPTRDPGDERTTRIRPVKPERTHP